MLWFELLPDSVSSVEPSHPQVIWAKYAQAAPILVTPSVTITLGLLLLL